MYLQKLQYVIISLAINFTLVMGGLDIRLPKIRSSVCYRYLVVVCLKCKWWGAYNFTFLGGFPLVCFLNRSLSSTSFVVV